MRGWKEVRVVELNRYQQRVLMTDFLLNCFVLGDDEERVFLVKISRNDNISTLKDEIKTKKSPHLNHLAASDLDLWKVCLPIDDPASKRPQAEPPLRVNKRFLHCGMVILRLMIYTSW